MDSSPLSLLAETVSPDGWKFVFTERPLRDRCDYLVKTQRSFPTQTRPKSGSERCQQGITALIS